MYQAVGMDSRKVYAKGTHANCLRSLNQNYPYVTGKKNNSGWGRGNIVTEKPVFKEPIRIVKVSGVLKGGEHSCQSN